MEYNIKLQKEECDLILNALQYLQNEKLKKSLEAAKQMKYENLKVYFESEKYFEEYRKNQIKIINGQTEAIESTYDKIINEMEGE